MSTLLINESPLMVLPSLAEKIGLCEAIILQQIHYLINSEFNKNIIEGKKWVYNTYEEWEKKFKFVSDRTLQRTFLNLEHANLLIVGRFNKNSRDRTKWYTINYEALTSLEIGTTCQIGTMDSQDAKLAPSMTPNWHHATCQIGTMSKVQKITLQEITHKDKNDQPSNYADQAEIKPSIDLTVDNNLKSVVNVKNAVKTPTKAISKSDANAFSLFWQKYPRRIAKAAAARVFHRAMQKTSLASILEALEAQINERIECGRLGVWLPDWKHPATWLNQECWADQVRSLEQIKQEAQVHWRQKMTYRDVKNLEGEMQTASILNRIAARVEAKKNVMEGMIYEAN